MSEASACLAVTIEDDSTEIVPIGKKNKELGARGELSAAWYLRRHEYVILDTNWKCNYGEVDIVAMDRDCLVFVEVKTRSSFEQGFPCEAVTKKKRRKYENIALAYLVCHDFSDLPMRFDVVDVVKLDTDRCAIKHHVNAFGVA